MIYHRQLTEKDPRHPKNGKLPDNVTSCRDFSFFSIFQFPLIVNLLFSSSFPLFSVQSGRKSCFTRKVAKNRVKFVLIQAIFRCFWCKMYQNRAVERLEKGFSVLYLSMCFISVYLCCRCTKCTKWTKYGILVMLFFIYCFIVCAIVHCRRWKP